MKRFIFTLMFLLGGCGQTPGEVAGDHLNLEKVKWEVTCDYVIFNEADIIYYSDTYRASWTWDCAEYNGEPKRVHVEFENIPHEPCFDPAPRVLDVSFCRL